MEHMYLIAALYADGSERLYRNAYTKQEYVMEALHELREKQEKGDKTVYYYCEFEVVR